MPAKHRPWEASQLHDVAAAAALHKAAAIQKLCGSDGLAVACRRVVFVITIVYESATCCSFMLALGTLALSSAPRRTTSRARHSHPARLRLSGLWAVRRAAAQRLSLRFATMQFAQEECQRRSLRAASLRSTKSLRQQLCTKPGRSRNFAVMTGLSLPAGALYLLTRLRVNLVSVVHSCLRKVHWRCHRPRDLRRRAPGLLFQQSCV